MARKKINTPTEAWAAFRTAMSAIGATVTEPEWRGALSPHRVTCSAGHPCTPRPANVQQGAGICQVCAGKDPVVAEAAFRVRVAELGGTVTEPKWRGMRNPHRVTCAAGHACTPRPNSIRQGQGICRVCAGRDPATAEAAFRASMAAIGATVTEPEWRGTDSPHRVICASGHACTPRPGSVRQGQGICRVCARQDPATAEAAFRASMAAIGATITEPEWRGVLGKHRVICSAGHECAPTPGNVHQGWGICRICAGLDTATAEAAFRAAVTAQGGAIIEPLLWRGVSKPHEVICREGHQCSPWPASIQQGQGICRVCANRVWDHFYVVTNSASGRVKFGVTSNDFRRRLRTHRKAGYAEVLRKMESPRAKILEDEVLNTLKLAGIAPVRGREYFDISALPLILDIVDNYPTEKIAS